MDETKADLRTGAVLNGRYRVVELLGEGGMGLVYRGERLQLGRPVAIKFLHSPYAKSAKFVARFEREARAMSQLAHPHCVSVIDFGMHDAPYIVMDFITGSTLRDVLDRGPVTVTRALAIIRQVLLGLAHAHELGIVHRDIKPGNIMLATVTGMDDQVRIFDFGLAKLHHADSDGDPSTASVVGTPAYMAPEQASAGRVDARADVYATGIVLFEMLAGHKPFQGDDAFTVLCMQRDTLPPRLEELKPALSQALCAAVDKTLAKDPGQRFQSATDLIAAIDALPETRTGSFPEPTTQDAAFALAATMVPLVAEAQQRTADGLTPLLAPGEATEVSVEPIGSAPTQARKRPRGLSRAVLAAAVLSVFGAGVWQRAALLRAIGADANPAAVSATPEQAAQSPEAVAAAAAVQHDPQGAEPSAAPSGASAVPAPDVAEPAPEVAQPEAAEPEVAEHAQAALPVAPAEPAPADPAPTASAPAEPAQLPGAAENTNAAADDLTEAQLAAADRALDDTTREPNLSVPETAAPKVRNAAAARALARQGKVDAALAGLRALRRRDPKNAELATTIGDLYFERGWRSDALSKYREAIRLNARYKRRDSIQRNAIRALEDTRTYGAARALLVKDIGRGAATRLRKAAKSSPNRTVRARATSVLAALR